MTGLQIFAFVVLPLLIAGGSFLLVALYDPSEPASDRKSTAHPAE
jgi:hypothetical protein